MEKNSVRENSIISLNNAILLGFDVEFDVNFLVILRGTQIS